MIDDVSNNDLMQVLYDSWCAERDEQAMEIAVAAGIPSSQDGYPF